MLVWTFALAAVSSQPIPPPLPPAHDEGPGGGGDRHEMAATPHGGRDAIAPVAGGEAGSVAVEERGAVPPAARSMKARPGVGPAVEDSSGARTSEGPEGIALSAVVGAGGGAMVPDAETGPIAARVRALAVSADPVDVDDLRRTVAAGLPPGVLVAALVTLREHPNPLHLNLLRDLSTYRRAEVRGQALAALAALGAGPANEAVLAALDDMDPGIRRLGLHLAELHSDPIIEEAVLALRERAPGDFEFPEHVLVVDLDGEDEEDLVVDVDLVVDLEDEPPTPVVAATSSATPPAEPTASATPGGPPALPADGPSGSRPSGVSP